jgi:antitoxin (DNA-binding transcriptional repressor) of toxin-antitoxin stability system
MARVTVREFSYNPSAMFARVESGESIEVTRHGKVIAALVPPPRGESSWYADMVARGEIRPVERKSWDEMTHIDVPNDVDPLAVLLEMREDER